MLVCNFLSTEVLSGSETSVGLSFRRRDSSTGIKVSDDFCTVTVLENRLITNKEMGWDNV